MWKVIVSIIGVLFLAQSVHAQQFVQLEVYNSTKTIKYAPGQKIVFKTKEFPKEWQKRKIEKIMYEENIIIFPQGMVHLDEITHVKTKNLVSLSLARLLYVFAGTSLVYGGIGDIVTGQFSPGLILFTAGPAGLGFFLEKVVTPKVYYLGTNSRLRLLDLRMF